MKATTLFATALRPLVAQRPNAEAPRVSAAPRSPGANSGEVSTAHDIPARSRLLPTIPITSPQLVYRRAHQTDLRATFARVRAGLVSSPESRSPEPPVRNPAGAPVVRAASGVRLVR
jgi:hypothetical protein